MDKLFEECDFFTPIAKIKKYRFTFYWWEEALVMVLASGILFFAVDVGGCCR